MPNDKKTKTVGPIDIDALVEKRMSVSKDELRQQILEEQVNELLQSDAIQKATLHDAIEHLKDAGKEIWKFISARPVTEIARIMSGTDRLEKKLKSKRRGRRASLTQAEVNENKKKLMELLKASKEAQTVGQIIKNLPLDSYFLKKLLGELRKANLVTVQGEKRSTRYSAA